MERLLSRQFVTAFGVALLSQLSFFLFVHFPGFLQDLGSTEAEIGIVVATASVSALAIRPHLGRELDRRGRRPILLVGGFANTVATGLYLLVHAVSPWMFGIRIVHGFAAALSFTTIFTIAADIVPESRRTQGLALFGLAGLFPIALGGVIGDLVLPRWGFDGLFTVALALSLLSFLGSVLIAESSVPAGRHAEVSFTRPLFQRDLLPLWWITFVFTVALIGYFTFLRTFVNETGLGSVGGFFAAYAGTAIAFRALGGWAPDRFGAKRILYPAMASLAAGCFVLATAGSDLAVIVSGVLCGAGHAYAFPILFAMSFGRAAAGDRGSASAIFTGLFDLGSVVGGPALGVVATIWGYTEMFLVAGGLAVVGSLIFAVWDGDLRRTTRVSLG